MSATATETTPQVNGDTTYSSKFLPKVTSIPVVTSLKKQFYTYVPQAEVITNYVYGGVSTAFNYTHNTPVEPVLIKLDTLAASGFEKFQKEVPIVNAPTDEVLKKTKVSKATDILVQLYSGALDMMFNVFHTAISFVDPILNPVLDRVEAVVGTKPQKNESPTGRIKRISGALYGKADAVATPYISKSKEIYANNVLPVAQMPMKQFNVQKDKATETVSPYVSEAKSRYSGAESAAKDAWTKTKPDNSGPIQVIPTVKSGIFTGITFGYTLLYPEDKKPSPEGIEKGVKDQTNGLVSGVDLADGETRKRPNGVAS